MIDFVKSKVFRGLRERIVLRLSREFPALVPEKCVVKAMFKQRMGYKLDLKHPKTFNEKLNWLKLYYHNPLYTRLVDKIEVKKYVDNLLGEGYTFPLYGVWESPDDIDFDKLPNQFVLKCNHNSAMGLTICKDKKNGIIVRGKSEDETHMTFDEVREWLRMGLKDDLFKQCREWAYKNVPRRIFAEKYMTDKNGNDIGDYKFFCFNGEPLYVWVGTNYNPSHFDILTVDWKNEHVEYGYVNAKDELVPPDNYEEMVSVARKLAKGFAHVRIDLYNIDGKIYFGEYTFYTWAGFQKFNPETMDYKFGSLLHLPEKIK